MATDLADILQKYNHRRMLRTPILQQQTAVRDLYNSDVEVPLPDMGRIEKPATPNLLKQGVDQQAARIASTIPTLHCPPRNAKKREQDAAEIRRKALLGLWEMNHVFDLIAPRRARHLVAYSCAPVSIGWNRTRGIPSWHMRDPLATFPTPSADVDKITPDDVIFTYTKTRQWVQQKYPDQYERMFGYRAIKPDERVTILEYNDATETVVVCAADTSPGTRTPVVGNSYAEILERIPNRAGMCTAVIPSLFTLDRIQGQFDGIIGMYGMQARLMALAVIAEEKRVFPDLVMIGQNGQEPKLLGDVWKDGRTGEINTIIDGAFQEVNSQGSQSTGVIMDRIERSARLSAGIPSEYGGESGSNIRTGRRGDAVLSAVVDFPIQEAQRALAASYQEENKRAIAALKGYAGSRSNSYYVNWRGTAENISYVPNDVFTTDENLVYFAHAGSDAQQVTVMVGQLRGLELVSAEWARENLPVIDDPQKEKDRIVSEKVNDALLAAFLQKTQDGTVALEDAAWFAQQITDNKLEPAEAMIQLNRRVQERQASAGPVGAPDGPVMPGTPEAQAGLAAGTPAELQAMPPSLAGPTDNLSAAASLMNRLRQVSRPVGEAV